MDIIWILEKPSKHSLSLIAEPNSDCIACSYSIFKQTFNQYVRKWYSSLDKSMYRNFMFGKLIYDTFQCKCKLQWNASFTGFCGNSKFSHFASFHDKNFEECNSKSKFFLIAFIDIIWTVLSAFPKIKMIVGCGQVNLATRTFAKLIVTTVKASTVITCHLSSNLVNFNDVIYF